MNAIVDNHEAPMVLSSIMKQNVTDRGRNMVNAGMDVLGGAGISMGDSNYIGGAYMSFPIAITVEGANIMTRSFQIIGQGLMRCHPHLLDVVEALEADDEGAPARFMAGVGAMAKHGAANLGRSLASGARVPMGKGGPNEYLEANLERLKEAEGARAPGLMYNEFIVYDTAQIEMKYVVVFDMDFLDRPKALN